MSHRKGLWVTGFGAGVVLVVAAAAAVLGGAGVTATPAAESGAGAPALQMFDQERVSAGAVVASAPLVQGTTLRAAVEIRVGRGFHVNANPASESFLIPTAVSLDTPEDGSGDITVAAVFYPSPLERTFSFWTAPLKVWEGNVVAGVILEIGEGAALGDRNLDFIVDYQACNDEACFAPTRTTARVPVVVEPGGTPTRALNSPLLERAEFGDGS